MRIKVLGTGSSGNGYVITDSNGDALIVEVGMKLNIALANCENPIGFIYSHEHSDHCEYKDKYEKAMPFYNIKPNYTKNIIGNYNVIGFPVLHNVDNKGFIIANKTEKKILFFATDLIYNSMTKCYYENLFFALKNINIDLLCIESSYNEYEYKCATREDDNFFGVKNHLSNYECARFASHLCDRSNIQNILLIHGSNRIGRSIKGKKEPILRLIPKAKITIANCGTEIIY